MLALVYVDPKMSIMVIIIHFVGRRFIEKIDNGEFDECASFKCQ